MKLPTLRQLGAKGYWITDTGQFIVEFKKPTRFDRFVGFFTGWSWTDYK